VNGLIADLNGDGAPDVVVGIDGSPPVVYLNNGTSIPFQNVQGVFVAPPPGVNGPNLGWGAVTLADVNNDGHPDLVAAGFNSPNLIYLNNGSANPFNGVTGVAIGTQDVAYSVAVGDVNGDGFVDMAVANSNHIPSRVYLTNGAPLTAGTYSTVQVGTDLGYGQNAVIADINGDGKPDLILTYIVAGISSTDPSGIAIYLNNGTNNPFNNVTPLRFLVGQSIEAVSVADLNGDGQMDLVAAVSDATLTQSHLYVYLNTGSATAPFATPQTLITDNDLGGGCISIAVGDIDGDGHPDLLFGCTPPLPNASPVPAKPAVGAIYLNNGTAIPFANVAPVDIPATAQSSYARGLDVGVLVHNTAPSVLIVDVSIAGSQMGGAAYAPTKLDQNPVAQNDAVVVAINKSILVNILANDTASTGQTLNARAVTIAQAPAHGAATINSATGAITYMPVSGYSGTDSFQYNVQDNLGAQSNTANVTVTIQPAPVATNDTATLQANSSVMIAVLSNDTSSGGTLNTASIAIAVAPTHGTAVVSNGEVTYTPATGYSGVDTFQYSIKDNLGTPSNVATVSINVTPPPSGGGGGGGGGSFSFPDILALIGLTLLGSTGLRSTARVHLKINR
jgi:hypothetical protein